MRLIDHLKANDKGVGDTIARATSAVGVKPKKGCGCGERRERLNKAFPYKPKEK